MRNLRSAIQGFISSHIWLACHGVAFRRSLRDRHGLTEVIPVGCARWHRGSRYFRARARDGRKVFVKTDGDHHLLANEVAAWTAIRRQVASPVRFAAVHQYELDGPHPFAAFEWIDGRPLAQLGALPPQSFERLADELHALLRDLQTTTLIHRDISPDNLLISFNHGLIEHVTLIDFAFAVCDGASASDDRLPSRELEDLAYGFKPAPFRWDDAYACNYILRQRLGPEQAVPAALAAIALQIGYRVFEHHPAPFTTSRPT